MNDHEVPEEARRILGGEDWVVWRNRSLLLFDRVPVPCAVCRTDGGILMANPAMAAEWGAAPGQLAGRNVLELFHPNAAGQVYRIVEAVRLGRRSRYPIEVRWQSPDGTRRYGELTADTVSDTDSPMWLLVLLRVLGEEPRPQAPGAVDTAPGESERPGPVEARILALAAGGHTTARMARQTGLTVDGVNYHLTRLSRRWGVGNRAELVARAYVLGVLAPGVWPPEPA
ncbi:PAS domain-containing protein [Streptomyces sp. NPDC019937]|uniref:helix-turn-helix transcriptional regulator n=1 Tax=Streptomyces sp. NPDC019937 TaxID=3154787 RepID=UPI0033F6C03B